MASDTVSCSPKTFSPRVLIHRTDYNRHTNTHELDKPKCNQSNKSLTASSLNESVENWSPNKTDRVEFEFVDKESGRKQSSHEMVKTDSESLRIRQYLPLNRNCLGDQKFVSENGPDYWNESMKYLTKCCKCCPDFSSTCLQQPKDSRDFRTIFPHIFKIKDEQFDSNPKSDSLRWTFFNSSILNKNILDFNYAQTFDGPIWSNRLICPDLESYSHHLLKEDIFNTSKASKKSITSLADSVDTSPISSCLTKTLPIAIGNSCYNTCDITKSSRIFWPWLTQNQSALPVPSSSTSLSFNIAPTTSSSSTLPSTSSSLSSVCLVRKASFFTYDPKPVLCDGIGSSALQSKLNHYTPERESPSPKKRFKYPDRKDIPERYHSDIPFVNSVISTNITKHQNGAAIAKTTSIYKVPKDILNEKRQIQKLKNFHCPFCDVSCSNRGQLQGHVRIHTGERPFVCQEPQCRKAFIRNEELTRHRRIHTGERPHICPICKKAFTRKDHLSKHLKTHT